jgi:hypothetical protein
MLAPKDMPTAMLSPPAAIGPTAAGGFSHRGDAFQDFGALFEP